MARRIALKPALVSPPRIVISPSEFLLVHHILQRANVKIETTKIMQWMRTSALFAAFMMAGATGSFAHSGTEEEQQACTPDVFRLCSAQIPSEERIVACLNKNMAKLSPACRAVMKGDAPKSKSREKR